MSTGAARRACLWQLAAVRPDEISRTVATAGFRENRAMRYGPVSIPSLPQLPRRLRGVTLLELMLVVGLVGILAAIAVPAYDGYLTRANNSKAASDLRELALRITRYELDNVSLPTSLADIDANELLDPWGNPYRYLSFEGLRGLGAVRKDGRLNPINSDYDLYSMGPDGRTATSLRSRQGSDDIVRASNGGFYGVAEEY
jgi:general secretion pathway protein G